MSPYTYCLFLSIIFLVATIYFVKTRTLEFKYSLFWVTISIMLIILSLDKNLTERMAKLVNISYAPAFLFVSGIVFIFFLIFYLTIVISKMQNKITRLTQEIGIIMSSNEKGEGKE